MRRRTTYLVLLVAVVVVVNLPLAGRAVSDAAGESGGGGLVIATVVADLVLLTVVLVLWRSGGWRRPQLEAVAMADVERCPEGFALDRIDGELYLVRGEVAETGPDRVVLEVGGRSVAVRLDGHANPVGLRAPAQVRARLVG